jgi:hypothetical protein
MKLFREVAAIAVFIVALIAFAGGVYWLAVAWAIATQNQQPIDVVSLAGGLLACALGVLFLVISRALDPEHGPVRSYRQRSRKSHTHASA